MARAPGAIAARLLALLAGAAGAVLGITYFLGVSYDPTNYLYVTLGASHVALFAGATAANIVRPPRGALHYGRAIEMNGMPVADSLKVFGQSLVQMGPVKLLLPKARSSEVRLGVPVRLVIALGVPPMRTPGFGVVPRGVLLEVNGSPLPKPPIVFVSW
jgi:hypothetical protein